MDKIIEINTGPEAVKEFTTDKIIGELKAIIFSNEKNMQIEINSELGYPIFNQRSERVGVSYYSIQTAALNEKAERQPIVMSSFYLNERLIITVRGQRNATMKIILRIE